METGGSSRPRESQVLSMGFVYPHPETMATGKHAPHPNRGTGQQRGLRWVRGQPIHGCTNLPPWTII